MKKIDYLVATFVVACCIASPQAWAGSSASFVVIVNTTISPTLGGYTWDYRVRNQSEIAGVSRFLIPELHFGDLVAQPLTFPTGWTSTEITASTAAADGFVLPTIYSGAPIATFLLVDGNGRTIPAGGVNDRFNANDFLDFNFFSRLGGSTAASFDFQSNLNTTVSVDPPIPAPEPGEAALLVAGGLGALALRRRKAA